MSLKSSSKASARLASLLWLPYAAALLAGALFLFQVWRYAHTQESVLDEGAYLYKGWLFASGQYTPFQTYGPWTNHMPLAFLIPGYAQVLFGAGVDTGRFLALCAALLTLLGMWISARRLGGNWWAAAAIGIFALNPALAKMYSVAVTQGWVSCLLTWMLVFTLGEKRPLWQIALGGLLAGALWMTRINMLPILPLLVLYVWWEHGCKAAAAAVLAGSGVVILGHALYWPNILQAWNQLPRQISPFLTEWRVPKEFLRSWKPEVLPSGRLLSVLHTLRFHFAAVMGVLATWLLMPAPQRWEKQPSADDRALANDRAPTDEQALAWERSNFRAVVFLSGTFLTLLLAHAWAALGKDYCVFCLAGYVTFFHVLGILTLGASFAAWRRRLPAWVQILVALGILLLSAGIGFGSFENTGKALMDVRLPALLVGSARQEAVALGAVLSNKFGLETQTLRRLLPTLAGLGLGLFTLGLALGLRAWQRRRAPVGSPASQASFGYWALVIFLAGGIILSPSAFLGGGYNTYDCSGDVLASYQAAGEHLASQIPPGAQTYWKGGLSVVPLLYAPEVAIYPPQINGGYSYFDIGDSDTLLRLGYWNEELSHQWAEQDADYILIEERSFKGWLRELVEGGGFEQLPPTPPIVPCREDAQIRIFRRQ